MVTSRPYLAIFGILPSLISYVTADTCSSVRSVLPSVDVDVLFQLDYTAEQLEYWSRRCTETAPTCILAPKSATELASIVQILNQNNESFAIKSGGHNPNFGFSCIDKGPLISTKNLKTIDYDATAGTVRVGPGNRWDDVAAALDGTGYTPVGGRIGNVGVGGYIVGGGLSFLSAQYGWAANNIREFEVVLANASVVRASADSNSELFHALKGGGRSFGIVTEYVMETHPIGQVYGGNIIYGADQTEKILAAVRDFTEYYPDEKAGIICTAEQTLYSGINIWILFVFYDGPTPPAGVFDNFTSIPHSLNTLKTQSYADLLTGNNWAVLKGSIYTINTETTPLPGIEVSAEVLGTLYDHWYNVSTSIKEVTGLVSSVAFQPFPAKMAQKAIDNGGDLIDLDASVDRIILEFDFSYLFNIDNDKVDEAIQRLYGGLREWVLSFQEQGKLPEAYLPLFMNDAYWRQDYWGRLRTTTTDFAKQVQTTYDPAKFWESRTQGWNIS